ALGTGCSSRASGSLGGGVAGKCQWAWLEFWAVIVVQAGWSAEGRLCLWAEDSALPARTRSRSRLHPFAAPHESLTALLDTKGVAAEVELWLPGSTSFPIASPELV